VLYVDSSALIKRYIDEIRTDELNIRLQEAVRARDPILTSILSYAEIHAALARKLKDRLSNGRHAETTGVCNCG
jgi:predicted nucleic acid-binding protein